MPDEGREPEDAGPVRAPRREDAAAFAAAALVLGIVCAGLTWFVVSGPDGGTALDESIGSAIHSVAVSNAWLVDLSLVLDWVGGGGVGTAVVAVVALALLVTGGARRPWGLRTYAAAFLILSAAGGSIINTAVKAAVERPRPPWNGLWASEASSSYPSGHAQAGITVWVALAVVALVLLPGRGRWVVAVPLLVLGPVIGMSRTLLGVHWPTDVLGGWTLGGAWMSASAVIVILVASRRSGRQGSRP